MSVFISEYNIYSAIGSGDFVEVSAPAGQDVSGYSIYVYDTDGTIASGPYSFGSAEATMFGQDIYVIDAPTDGMALSASSSIALVDDGGDVVQFVAGDGFATTASEGPANGLTSTTIGAYFQDQSMQSDDGGTSYFQQPSQNSGTIPCFAAGTLIDTPDGACAVETLQIGDLVSTVDSGPCEIVWTDKARLSRAELGLQRIPVLISAGAFGQGRPEGNLIVSQQHRILVGAAGQLEHCFDRACLAPAKALLKITGVRLMRGCRGIEWHHFALHKHGLVTAQGVVAESLLLGTMVVNRVPRVLRRRHSWSANTAGNGPMCRPCLTVREAQNRIPLQAPNHRVSS